MAHENNEPNPNCVLQRFLWFTPFFPPSGDPPDQSGRFRRHKGSGICFFFQSCVTEGKRVHTLEIKDCTLAPIHPAMPHGISVIQTNSVCIYAGFVIQESIRLCSNNISKIHFWISSQKDVQRTFNWETWINTISILAETTCKMRHV